MNFSAILHQAKSEYAYAFDESTLHIRLKTAKGEAEKIELLATDPFNWIPRNDGSLIYDFNVDAVVRVFMEKEQVTEDYDCWFAEIKDIKWKRIKYCFIIEDKHEKYIFGYHNRILYKEGEKQLYDLFNYFNYPYINEEDLYRVPEWVSSAVWYQIFPERFRNGTPGDGRNVLPWGSEELDGGNQKFGGNLLGIMEKLDYIKESGFTAIYMTPIFESPSSHKYDIADYYKIDRSFGDNEILGELVDKAHEKGIKVMLDAVFNHCGFYHPFWQDVLKNGKDSKYYDCFYVLDPKKPIYDGKIVDGVPEELPFGQLNYRTFANTPAMPKWNTGDPIAREHLLDAACFWTEQYKIDGWRLDVSNEVSHDFWKEFRKRIKEINPDIYIVGENWDNSYPWLLGDQFDAAMNYDFAMPVWKYFACDEAGNGDGTIQEFRYAISKLLTDYPKHVTKNLFNLLESHDTERFLNRVSGQGELAQLAYIFLFTYPGTPSVYYGGEIGMTGGEHSNRQCMIWEEDRWDMDLLGLIRKLAELRKQYESFRSSEFFWLDEDPDILAYRKRGRRENLYVILNKGSQAIEYFLPDELKGATCTNCLTNDTITLQGSLRVEPKGYYLLLC